MKLTTLILLILTLSGCGELPEFPDAEAEKKAEKSDDSDDESDDDVDVEESEEKPAVEETEEDATADLALSVYDADGRLVGKLVDEDKLMMKLPEGGVVVQLKSLEEGFAADGADLQPCMFLEGDENGCDGRCFLALKKQAYFVNPAKLLVAGPRRVKYLMNGTRKAPAPGTLAEKVPLKRLEGGQCEATTAEEPGFHDDEHFNEGVPFEIKLPLTREAPE